MKAYNFSSFVDNSFEKLIVPHSTQNREYFSEVDIHTVHEIHIIHQSIQFQKIIITVYLGERRFISDILRSRRP